MDAAATYSFAAAVAASSSSAAAAAAATVNRFIVQSAVSAGSAVTCQTQPPTPTLMSGAGQTPLFRSCYRFTKTSTYVHKYMLQEATHPPAPQYPHHGLPRLAADLRQEAWLQPVVSFMASLLGPVAGI
jgi:hypothetical protein